MRKVSLLQYVHTRQSLRGLIADRIPAGFKGASHHESTKRNWKRIIIASTFTILCFQCGGEIFLEWMSALFLIVLRKGKVDQSFFFPLILLYIACLRNPQILLFRCTLFYNYSFVILAATLCTHIFHCTDSPQWKNLL